MKDRELLELAAKTAGVRSADDGSYSDLGLLIASQANTENNRSYRIWNSLADDGDALRLAAKFPTINLSWVIAEAWQMHDSEAKRLSYIRRAITSMVATHGGEIK